ncbi:MAG TPA: TIGR04086 family membrane protein [Pelotomaculum sp.]|jgi:putative membrane protein (TIGR04086 family)|nr:TIGR04086 family membrane protein [Pelotomaculum sp.]
MSSINMGSLRSLINVSAVLKGTFLTLAVSLLLSIGTGIVYHVSSATEQTLPWFTGAILAASAFSGSLAAGKQAGSRGLYHGLATGLLFFLALLLLAGLFLPEQAGLSIFSKFLLSLSAGALGGIVGVSLT